MSGPWLVADIGGTNARFGLVHEGEPGVQHVRSMRCADFPSPQSAALAYLAAIAPDPLDPQRLRPQRVALALATPIHDGVVKMTNSPWTVSRAEVGAALGADRVLLLNDFESLAYALPGLDAEQVRWMGPARPDPRKAMAVIGPGTGLGVASCVPTPGGGWVALAAEGGHVTVAAADDFESEILRCLRTAHTHVSAERLLSGIGLPSLHAAVRAVRGGAGGALPSERLAAEAITHGALVERDPDCLATLDTFCAMLGGFAGNVALTVGARGGVFVAGGIAQKLGSDFLNSRFRERFEAKGRFRDYLAPIATGLVTAPHAALEGAAQALRHAGA